MDVIRGGARGRALGVLGLVGGLAGPAAAAPCRDVAPGQRATCSLEHGGHAREYRILVPRSVSAPAAVVLNLHGRKGTASEQETRLAAEAERHGFVLVSLQGYDRSWNAGVGFGGAHDAGIDDVGYVRAVIADLTSASATPIDARRVYATGLSNGARMVHRLACEASDVIAAIASVAGPISDRNEETGARAFHCRPPRPVPVMLIHGKRDRCTPYDGGAGMDTRGNVATPVAAREWAQRNRCTSVEVKPLGSTSCEIHRDCAGGAEVALCTMATGGHVWPGGPRFRMWQVCGGTWPDDFRASDQMWSFFAAHPLPGAGTGAARWQPIEVDGSPSTGPELDLQPVDSVDLPFDRSQLALTLRSTAPGSFEGTGAFRDSALVLSGAISLYSRLHVRGRAISAVRVMAQFRVEGETVSADMFPELQQVTKASLGVSVIYVAPSLNLYALYAGAAIAETRDTLSSPELMPTALGLGTYRSRKNLTWIYGGGLGYALGRPWLLPAAGLAWKMSPTWSLTTILPIFVDLRRTVSRKLAVNLLLAVSGDRFRFEGGGAFGGGADPLVLQLGQGKLGVGVTYRWTRRWTLRGELGVVGPRRLEITDGDATLMSSESKGAGYLSTTVSYAFGNAPL